MGSRSRRKLCLFVVLSRNGMNRSGELFLMLLNNINNKGAEAPVCLSVRLTALQIARFGNGDAEQQVIHHADHAAQLGFGDGVIGPQLQCLLAVVITHQR